MAFSFTDQPIHTNGNLVYSFSFEDGFFKEADINVYLQDTETKVWTLLPSSGWSLTTVSSITLVTDPYDPPATVSIRIRRIEDKTATYSTFPTQGSYDRQTVWNSFKRDLHLVHEALDGFFEEDSVFNLELIDLDTRVSVIEATNPENSGILSSANIAQILTDIDGTNNGGLLMSLDGVTNWLIDSIGDWSITGNVGVSGTLAGMTQAEMAQVGNIGSTVIGAVQWGYVGGMDQSVGSGDIVEFADIIMPDGGTIGQVAGPLLTFDDTSNQLEITGCSLGLGVIPQVLFHIKQTSATDVVALFESSDANCYITLEDGTTATNEVRIGAVGGRLELWGGGGRVISIDGPEVGINTINPDGTLHVHTASAGVVTASVAADDLVIENAGNGGISILTADSSQSAIYFGSPSDSIGAIINWRYDDNFMNIGVSNAGAYLVFKSGNGVEAMRLKSTGIINIPDLAGTGTRNVVVDAAGNLSAP